MELAPAQIVQSASNSAQLSTPVKNQADTLSEHSSPELGILWKTWRENGAHAEDGIVGGFPLYNYAQLVWAAQ